MDYQLFVDIINNKMKPATGCTEPAAIALCAAFAAEKLEGKVSEISVLASVNIIKNAMAVGIPGTTKIGIEYAAAIGATIANPEKLLQIIETASDEEWEQAINLVEQGFVKLGKKKTSHRLYIEVEVKSYEGNQARAIITLNHTNLVYLEVNNLAVLTKTMNSGEEEMRSDKIEQGLNIQDIYDFVHTVDREKFDLHMIEEAIHNNMRISEEGESTNYGLRVGKTIASAKANGNMCQDIISVATEKTANAIDARMGGATYPVITNSGSGNQGITATVPVVAAAEYLGIDEDKMFRAVTLSHLIAIYIHSNTAILSALCGGTIAGTGASCGLVYLLGGGPQQLSYAVNNMLGCVAGMLCDGAKPDCSMKISACVNVAFLSAYMAMDNIGVSAIEGIVSEDPAHTVKNFARVSNEGSPVLDNIILDIMLNK